MPKKDNDDLRLNDGQLGVENEDESTGLGDLGDGTPDWLSQDDGQSSADAMNELIEEARNSVDDMPSAEVNAARDALAQWSSAYADPAKELRDLERLRAQMKGLSKDKLKPGQYAAVKTRIAALKQLLDVS